MTNKHFTTIAYNLSGNLVLAGGNSPYVCLYDTNFQILLKKFKLTQNRSLDGLLHKLNSEYNMTDMDNNENEYDSANSDYEIDPQLIGGAGKSKLKKKNLQIKVSKVAFSYTNRAFIIASTEGVFYFSLDVSKNLAILQLDENVTPQLCIEAFKEGNFVQAITYSVYLNLPDILDKVFSLIDSDKIEYISKRITTGVCVSLLDYFAKKLENENSIQINLMWVFNILKNHKNEIKQNKDKNIFFTLNKAISKHYKNIIKLLEENLFTLDFLVGI